MYFLSSVILSDERDGYGCEIFFVQMYMCANLLIVKINKIAPSFANASQCRDLGTEEQED
jgi:hypothetical protein